MTDDQAMDGRVPDPDAAPVPPTPPAVAPPPGRVRLRHPGVVLSVVATVLAVAVVARTGHRGTHNVYVADSLRITPLEGLLDFPGDPGVIPIMSLVRLDPTAPITLLDVRPYRMTPGTNLVAVRVSFHGRGRTRSGHLAFQGYPMSDCAARLEGGFGASYPAEGIQLAANDPTQIIYYVQTYETGTEVVTGYRIRYRTARGKIRTVTGDLGRSEITPIPGRHDCLTRTSGWTMPAPGFPG